ncbi:MAG TPA: FliH/SctL family protein [Solirubrobacteraceae bacterium]
MSDAAVSYAFEPLEPSAAPPRDAAARVLAKAMADAERIRETARAEGLQEGRSAGHAQGAGEIAAGSAALAAAVAGIEALRAETVQAIESDAIDLSLRLAGKILAGAQQAQPELVVDVVQGALRRIVDRRRITVMVNPSDLEVVKAAIGELTAQGSGVETCDLQADERVGLGSAVVRTSEGEVDASVHTQLERAREVVELSMQSVESAAL